MKACVTAAFLVIVGLHGFLAGAYVSEAAADVLSPEPAEACSWSLQGSETAEPESCKNGANAATADAPDPSPASAAEDSTPLKGADYVVDCSTSSTLSSDGDSGASDASHGTDAVSSPVDALPSVNSSTGDAASTALEVAPDGQLGHGNDQSIAMTTSDAGVTLADRADSSANVESVRSGSNTTHQPISHSLEGFSASPLAPAQTPLQPQQASPMTSGDLEDLRNLLGQARHAVSLLDAAVTRQEQRLAFLTPGGANGGTAEVLISPSSADATTAALLQSLGMDPARTSVAARQALREAVQQVLQERDGWSSGVGLGTGTGTGVATTLGGYTGGTTAGDWFGQHFALRAAVRLPPLASQAEAPPVPIPSSSSTITCAFAYELPHPNAAATGGGALLFILAGDAGGRLLLLSPTERGGVLAAAHTGTDSPVTACSAFYVRRLEATIMTGHANGQTRSFAVVLQEPPPPAPSPAQQQQQQQQHEEGTGAAGTGAPPPPPPPAKKQKQRKRQPVKGGAGGEGGIGRVVVQSIRLRHVVESMPHGALPWAAVEELIAPVAAAGAAVEELIAPVAAAGAAPAEAGAAEAGATTAPEPAAAAAAGEEAAATVVEGATTTAAGSATAVPAADVSFTGPPAPIMHILPYKLGNKVGGRRHVLVVDRAGNLRLERDNGTVRFWARTNHTQLAVHFVGTHVVMLSAFQATVLNSMQPRQPRAFACQHLNGSRLLAASFDGHRPFRGYGINTRGELLSLATPHEGALSACKAHRATPLPGLDASSNLAASRHSLSLTPMRGYLLVTHGSHRMVLNVTGPVRHGVPALVSSTDGQLVGVASAVATPAPPPPPPPPPVSDSADTSADPPPSPTSHPAWTPTTASPGGGLINGILPPPPVVAVAPGNQIVILGLHPPAHPPSPAQSQPQPPPQAATGAAGDEARLAGEAASAVVQAEGSGEGSSGASAAAGAAAAPPPPPPPGNAVSSEATAAGSAVMGPGVSSGAAPMLLVVLDSRMPRAAVPGGAGRVWSQPIFLGAMFLVGLYQFWRLTSNRTQRRTMTAGARGSRGRRGYGGGSGGGSYGGSYGDAAGYMYGENRTPLQPRSALRRGRSDRPLGRNVSYEDDEY